MINYDDLYRLSKQLERERLEAGRRRALLRAPTGVRRSLREQLCSVRESLSTLFA